jgi:hypothetical protein
VPGGTLVSSSNSVDPKFSRAYVGAHNNFYTYNARAFWPQSPAPLRDYTSKWGHVSQSMTDTLRDQCPYPLVHIGRLISRDVAYRRDMGYPEVWSAGANRMQYHTTASLYNPTGIGYPGCTYEDMLTRFIDVFYGAYGQLYQSDHVRQPIGGVVKQVPYPVVNSAPVAKPQFVSMTTLMLVPKIEKWMDPTSASLHVLGKITYTSTTNQVTIDGGVWNRSLRYPSAPVFWGFLNDDGTDLGDSISYQMGAETYYIAKNCGTRMASPSASDWNLSSGDPYKPYYDKWHRFDSGVPLDLPVAIGADSGFNGIDLDWLIARSGTYVPIVLGFQVPVGMSYVSGEYWHPPFFYDWSLNATDTWTSSLQATLRINYASIGPPPPPPPPPPPAEMPRVMASDSFRDRLAWCFWSALDGLFICTKLITPFTGEPIRYRIRDVDEDSDYGLFFRDDGSLVVTYETAGAHDGKVTENPSGGLDDTLWTEPVDLTPGTSASCINARHIQNRVARLHHT